MHTRSSEILRDLAEDGASALDRLIYSDAAGAGLPAGDLFILEDSTFALTLWALADLLDRPEEGRVLVRLRSYAQARDLLALVNTEVPEALPLLKIAGLGQDGAVEEATFAPADFLALHRFDGSLALGRLPKSHGALADWAHALARHWQGQQGRLVLGGNTKHMSTGSNEVLARYFSEVHGLRGRGKNRCVEARQPLDQLTATPATTGPLLAWGGVFSGSKPDRGGQLLARVAADYLAQQEAPQDVLDFGCGNGTVSHYLLKEPAGQKLASLLATDIDLDAVRSASANLADSLAEVFWDDAAASLPASSLDVVLLNPPFHDGTRVDLTLVQPLLDAVVRLLRPGGVLLLVHNSHARYRPELEARLSQVDQVARDRTFTVLRALRR